MFNLSVAHSSDIFNEIKRNINILAVIERYSGLKLERKGRNFKSLCPFHPEKTPSFTVDPGKSLFFCFGCGVGGDAVTFVAQIYGLTPIEAAKMIASDFGLQVHNRPLTSEQRIKIRKQQRKQKYRKALQEWCKRRYLDLCTLYRLIHFHKATDFINYIPAIERDLNILQFGTDKEKWQLFRERSEHPWLL